MSQSTIKEILKSVWAVCAARNSSYGSPDCSKYTTKQIVFVRKTKKKLANSFGLDLSYDDNLIEGKYCAECAPVTLEFLKTVHTDEILETQSIPNIEIALDFIRE